VAGIAAITGATGFLGRNIVAALAAAGWRVRILARHDPVHPLFLGIDLDVVPGDVSDKGALRHLTADADVVVHAAGVVKAMDDAGFHRVNVGGTQNLLDAMQQAGASARVMLISSLAAREPAISAYARSKRAAEDTVKENAGGRPWVIVRPCAIYGPEDRETLALFAAVSKGIVPRFAPENARVAMLFVQDAAHAVANLCAAQTNNQVYELSDVQHQGYTWRMLRDHAEQALATKSILVPVPRPLVHGIASANGAIARLRGRAVMFGPGKAREVRHADWSSPSDRQPPPDIWTAKTDLPTGFRATVAWYREHGWLPPCASAPHG